MPYPSTQTLSNGSPGVVKAMLKVMCRGSTQDMAFVRSMRLLQPLLLQLQQRAPSGPPSPSRDGQSTFELLETLLKQMPP